MVVIAKYTTCGMTRGKKYDVIEKGERCYKIVLDDGSIAYRFKKAFDVEE